MGKARRLQEGASAASAATSRELLFIRMVIETAKFIQMREIPFGEREMSRLPTQRGIVRGMALSITKAYGNGYEPYWSKEVRECEKRAASIAREWINDGQPEGDGWWLRRRGRLWRSRSDAANA